MDGLDPALEAIVRDVLDEVWSREALLRDLAAKERDVRATLGARPRAALALAAARDALRRTAVFNCARRRPGSWAHAPWPWPRAEGRR